MKIVNFITVLSEKWLKGNQIEMYSAYNEGKSVAAERFMKTLKNKIHKYLKAVSKKIFFYVLNYTVDKY